MQLLHKNKIVYFCSEKHSGPKRNFPPQKSDQNGQNGHPTKDQNDHPTTSRHNGHSASTNGQIVHPTTANGQQGHPTVTGGHDLLVDHSDVNGQPGEVGITPWILP